MIVFSGIDGSQRACDALAFAAQLCDPTKDRFVLYCSPRRIHWESTVGGNLGAPEFARQALAGVLFERASACLPPAFRSTVSTLINDQKPVEGIVQGAKDQEAGLIVVGAHGATARRLLFPGGVARGVAHRATAPVLMVRETARDRAPGPLRVLLAHCRTPACEHAAALLQQFHWPADTIGSLVHVVEALDPSYVEVLEQHQGAIADDVHRMLNEYRQHLAQDKHRALEELRQVQTKLPSFFQHTTPLTTEGHVVEQIMDCVQREKIDLLIVGARSLTAVGRWLSSVTESLMLHCPCSLVISH